MATPGTQLQPLPYHEGLANYLRTAETEAWDWFASTQAQSDYAEELRLDLLKQTYRLDPMTYPEVFRMLDQARACLTPDLPVTLYQSQKSNGLNASIFYLPGEAHIVFDGILLQLFPDLSFKKDWLFQDAALAVLVVDGLILTPSPPQARRPCAVRCEKKLL